MGSVHMESRLSTDQEHQWPRRLLFCSLPSYDGPRSSSYLVAFVGRPASRYECWQPQLRRSRPLHVRKHPNQQADTVLGAPCTCLGLHRCVVKYFVVSGVHESCQSGFGGTSSASMPTSSAFANITLSARRTRPLPRLGPFLSRASRRNTFPNLRLLSCSLICPVASPAFGSIASSATCPTSTSAGLKRAALSSPHRRRYSPPQSNVATRYSRNSPRKVVQVTQHPQLALTSNFPSPILRQSTHLSMSLSPPRSARRAAYRWLRGCRLCLSSARRYVIFNNFGCPRN
jgi:hypothetical protein